MNKYYIQLVLLLLLSLYLSHAHAGLFGGAKIEKNITYELMNSNLQIIDSLPIAQSNSLLALDAAMRGIKSKR